MILIEQRVDNNEDQRRQKPALAQSVARRATKRARSQECEYRVFREVRDFSGDAVDYEQRLRRGVRKQPKDQWSNDARCVSCGEVAG